MGYWSNEVWWNDMFEIYEKSEIEISLMKYLESLFENDGKPSPAWNKVMNDRMKHGVKKGYISKDFYTEAKLRGII